MNSADKLLSVLSLFSTRAEPWSVNQVADALGLPQSTTYRYMRSLATAGLIAAISAGSFVLGPTIVILDRQMRRSDPLLVSSSKIIDDLAAKLPVPGVVLLCRLFRSRVMCVHSVNLQSPRLEPSFERGRPMPLYRGAASKAILAHLPLRTVRGFFQQDTAEFVGANLGGTWAEVKSSLRRLRNSDPVVTHSELDRDVIGIASPLFDESGQVFGSLGFVSPGIAVTDPIVPELNAAVRHSAGMISASLRNQ